MGDLDEFQEDANLDALEKLDKDLDDGNLDPEDEDDADEILTESFEDEDKF